MAQRRLAVISGHLFPSTDPPATIYSRRPISAAICGSAAAADGDGRANDCVFCTIIRGESPAFKLYEDDTCLCILDSNPLSYGHSLIIPKLHFASLGLTPPDVVAAMCATLPLLSNAIMRATHSDSFNLLVNNGSAAGQVIFHTHFHIIPRKSGDMLWHSESLRRQPIKWNHDTICLANSIRERVSFPLDSCRDHESSLQKDALD